MLSKKISLATSISVGFVGALSAFTPANAVTVPGCGEIRDLRSSPSEAFRGTLINSGGYCEATFLNSGQAQLILPDGVSDLYGIVVAGGGGTYLYNYDNRQGLKQAVGYAGNGGEAKTLSWGNLASNSAIDVEVGKRGENGSADAVNNQTSTAESFSGGNSSGVSSSVSLAGASTVLTSLGGLVGNDSPNPYCTFTPWEQNNPELFVSLGKSGTGTVRQSVEPCEQQGLAGLNPAAAPSPTIFSNKVANFGKGGGIYTSAPASTQLQAGEGASIVANDMTGRVGFTDAQDGIVILKYKRAGGPTNSAPTYYSPTFGITFDGNGADNLSDTALFGQLSRSGYRFVGWNTKADGSGSPFVLGKSISVSGDMKLFAQWVKKDSVQKSKKQISTFAGDSAALKPAMKKQIESWVRLLPADGQIVCNGSTSGRAVTSLDKRLAKARAINVCNYAVQLRPDLTYKTSVSPSSANKVSARNVWMSLWS